ncbi:MAG: P83/100 family protein [Spirochaetia bacterium]
MKQFFIFTIVILGLVYSAFSIEVDRSELQEEIENTSISFTNYTGPHDQIDTVEAIYGIGSRIGSNILDSEGSYSYFNKYRVIHAMGDPDDEGSPADIFIIERGASVDHIANVRLILKGYLENSYGYSSDDAALLARFITIYNAVFRNNLEFFQGNFNQEVLNNVTAENVGISTLYSDWPGNTRMIIPLRREAGEGELGSVEAERLAENEVVEEMREEEEDRGLEDRRDLVDLEERQLEEDYEEVEEGRGQIEEDEERIQQEEEEVEEEEEEVEQRRQELEEERREVEQQREEEGETEEVQQREEELQRQEEEAQQQEREVQERREQLEEERSEVQQRQEETEEREQELQERQEEIEEQRESIAEDQQEVLEEESRQAAAEEEQPSVDRSYFMKVRQLGNRRLAVLYAIDRNAQEELGSTQGVDIVPGFFRSVSDGLIVMIFEDETTAYFGLLDEESLSVIMRSGENLYPDSMVYQNGEDIYAVVSQEGSYYLARFNTALEVQSISGDGVAPYTYITQDSGSLIVQSPEGDILYLDTQDLTTSSSFQF